MEWKFDGAAPIYTQIVDALRRRIVSGGIPPGERLPAVRELALEAGVNPNTMQRALTELERQGLVYTLRTSGRFVTEDRGTIERSRAELARQMLRDFARDMAELGYSGAELNELMNEMTSEEENNGDT